MALDNIFGIAGSALNAQTVRMNATASNLANASTVASSDKDAFRGKRVTFKTIMEAQTNGSDLSNVNEMSEMVEMMAAARSYQNNVEVVNTTRQLMMRTLDIIKS